MDDMRRNGSGYSDPTAYGAFKNISKSRKSLAYKVIRTLYNVSHLAGFEVVEIRIRDTTTGKVYNDRK